MATRKPLGQGCVAVADSEQTEAQGTKKKIEGKPGPPPLFQGLDTALYYGRPFVSKL